ncbi:MAG: TrbI/VirB10 family protein [Sphingomonas sp.]|jgi:type IV secretion system protein VirB10|uniref:TrbI/VirB10 family protein n=1 Tax=Sphingomonas sp. TaxID=28214 RepID=UPI00356A7647
MALAPPNDRDPRIAAGPGGEASIRPLVATDARPLPWWVFAIGVIVAALLLFVILDARRRDAYAPPAARPNDGQGAPVPITPLAIPPAPTPTPTPTETSAPPPAPIPMAPPPPRIIYVPQPAPQVMPPPQPPRAASEPALVLDTTVGDAVAAAAPAGAEGQPAATGGGAAIAARATVMRHRATTVAQGTLIPAVLESALDSTRPGPARALVQRDVRGFDGSTILIQRGSRLIGEYRADLQPGQNRALVMWTRLVRPDGVTVALGSPAADPLGRVGIKGKVNSHFFERFGMAILQSSLDVGVNLASRYGGSPVIVAALPGAVQSSTSSLTSGAQIQPTLRVRQGTAISVFVARDLDFTSVESRR